MTRPRLAVAWFDGLTPPPLDDDQRRRIDELCDVIDWAPLTDFSTERAGEVLADAQVLLGHWGCPTVDAEVLARAPRLAAFVYAAGTVKWVVTPEVFARGVRVTSGADANGIPVAHYALGAILLALKNAFVVREMLRDPTVLERPNPPTLPTGGISGKRIGIVGVSLIGRRLVGLLKPFDVDVVVYDPFLSTSEAEALGVTIVDLDELCATSDVVSLHAPPLPTTEGMMSAERLAAMPDGATLVNTARGMLVDHEALEAELSSGRISAVLDVTDPHEPLPRNSPLYSLPNVFLTPHIGGAGGTTDMVHLGAGAVEEIRRFCAGEPALHEVRADDWDRIA